MNRKYYSPLNNQLGAETTIIAVLISVFVFLVGGAILLATKTNTKSIASSEASIKANYICQGVLNQIISQTRETSGFTFEQFSNGYVNKDLNYSDIDSKVIGQYTITAESDAENPGYYICKIISFVPNKQNYIGRRCIRFTLTALPSEGNAYVNGFVSKGGILNSKLNVTGPVHIMGDLTIASAAQMNVTLNTDDAYKMIVEGRTYHDSGKLKIRLAGKPSNYPSKYAEFQNALQSGGAEPDYMAGYYQYNNSLVTSKYQKSKLEWLLAILKGSHIRMSFNDVFVFATPAYAGNGNGKGNGNTTNSNYGTGGTNGNSGSSTGNTSEDALLSKIRSKSNAGGSIEGDEYTTTGTYKVEFDYANKKTYVTTPNGTVVTYHGNPHNSASLVLYFPGNVVITQIVPGNGNNDKKGKVAGYGNFVISSTGSITVNSRLDWKDFNQDDQPKLALVAGQDVKFTQDVNLSDVSVIALNGSVGSDNGANININKGSVYQGAMPSTNNSIPNLSVVFNDDFANDNALRNLEIIDPPTSVGQASLLRVNSGWQEVVE